MRKVNTHGEYCPSMEPQHWTVLRQHAKRLKSIWLQIGCQNSVEEVGQSEVWLLGCLHWVWSWWEWSCCILCNQILQSQTEGEWGPVIQNSPIDGVPPLLDQERGNSLHKYVHLDVSSQSYVHSLHQVNGGSIPIAAFRHWWSHSLANHAILFTSWHALEEGYWRRTSQ